jgi:hypothetical protein
MNNENVIDPIEGIGVDGKIHLTVPWENKTICGIPIKHKSVSDFEIINLYHCVECFYER